MFDININTEDISILSIEREDIISVQKWINNQNCNIKDNEKILGLQEFYERFLEYYVSEGEFFLKIIKDERLIGVLKGRLEFKMSNEVWLWYFLLDSDFRGTGIGSKIITSLKSYFIECLGINDFYASVCEQDIRALRFWNNNGFKLIRVSKGYFSTENENLDMLILKNY
jgi:ribosomal protein S18 acetylase RimI-like enzyme